MWKLVLYLLATGVLLLLLLWAATELRPRLSWLFEDVSTRERGMVQEELRGADTMPKFQRSQPMLELGPPVSRSVNRKGDYSEEGLSGGKESIEAAPRSEPSSRLKQILRDDSESQEREAVGSQHSGSVPEKGGQ